MLHRRVWLGLAALVLCSSPWIVAQTTADLFDPTVVNDIKITMNPSDWSTLKANFLSDTKYPAIFTWKNITLEVAIKSRGSGSRSPIKPGIKVIFDYYEPGQYFLGLESVTLRNNTQDPSQMHEKLAMLFYAKMGLPGCREAFVRYYVNNEYIGLYTIVENLDVSFLNRAFNESNGYLYNFQHTPQYYHWEVLTDPAVYQPLFQPETNKDHPDWSALLALMQSLNSSSDASGDPSKYVNFNTFLAHLAVENYVAENDGITGDFGTNNFYLYRFAGNTIHQFLPWDRSNTFSFLGKSSVTRSVFANTDLNVITKKALAVPTFKTAYLQALVKMATLAGGAGGFLDTEITNEYNQIRSYVYADANKQCPDRLGNIVACTNDQFETEITLLHAFAQQRPAQVLAEVAAAGLPVPSLSISPSSLTFQTTPGTNPASQTLNISVTNSSTAASYTATVSSGATWLTVSPASGSTPTPITVSVAPGALAAGTYSATISIASAAVANSPLTVNVTLTIGASGPAPILANGAAVNSATSSGAILAPGSLVSVYGVGMATTAAGAPQLPLLTVQSGTSVLVNGRAAPLLYISPGQVNIQLPWEIPAGQATITASLNGAVSNAISGNVGLYSPGIFVCVYVDGAPVNSSRPAGAGDVIVCYATGLGPVTPTPPSGSPPSGLSTTTATLNSTIGGVTAPVLFSGLSGFVGLYQVNVQVPAGVGAGSKPVVFTIGGQPSPPSTIATK